MERLAAPSIALAGVLSLTAHGETSPLSSATSTPESVLPRSFVVSLSAVEEFFPEVTKEVVTRPKLDRCRQSKNHKERDLRERRQLKESDD